MRSFRPAVLVLSSLLLAINISAQQPPQRDPQALVILARSQAAMGGAPVASSTARVSSSGAILQDSIATGTITFEDGSSGPIVIRTKGAAQLRHDVTRNNKRISNVFNAGAGNRQQDGHKSELPVWVVQYQRPEHIPVFSRMADFTLPNTNVSYLGLEDVAGRQAHHIRLWSLPTDGTPPEVEELLSEFHVFIDSESLLVLKTQSYLFSPEIIENRIPVENYYSDYRLVGGVLVPYRIVRLVSGKKYSEIVFASVAFNVGLADSDFH